MAKVKKWSKQNRIFLNAYDKGCTDVLLWSVDVFPSYNPKKEHIAQYAAEFSVGERGVTLYATKKAELRPMVTLQREINKFNDAVEEAQRRCEEHNGES